MIDLLPKDYYKNLQKRIDKEIKAIDVCLARHRAIMNEVEDNLNKAKDVLDNYRRPD